MPVKAGVVRAGARNTRRGAAETCLGRCNLWGAPLLLRKFYFHHDPGRLLSEIMRRSTGPTPCGSCTSASASTHSGSIFVMPSRDA
jgi:hypothetical protein